MCRLSFWFGVVEQVCAAMPQRVNTARIHSLYTGENKSKHQKWTPSPTDTVFRLTPKMKCDRDEEYARVLHRMSYILLLSLLLLDEQQAQAN